MMYAWMGRQLHLHHSGGLDAKLAGLPGDVLMHAGCNMRDGGKVGASITNRKTVTASATVAARQSRQWSSLARCILRAIQAMSPCVTTTLDLASIGAR